MEKGNKKCKKERKFIHIMRRSFQKVEPFKFKQRIRSKTLREIKITFLEKLCELGYADLRGVEGKG